MAFLAKFLDESQLTALFLSYLVITILCHSLRVGIDNGKPWLLIQIRRTISHDISDIAAWCIA